MANIKISELDELQKATDQDLLAIVDVANNKTKKIQAGNLGILVPKTTKTTSDTETYSCNYVNGIVESGSNGNGNWIKYNDGTMICTQRFNKTINIQTAWGSWYYGSATCKDYPIAFVGDLPAVSCTAYPKTVTWCFGQLAHTSDGPQTLSNPGSVMCIRPTSQANVDVIVQIIAIGKWK